MDGYLYAVDSWSILSFDISNGEEPEFKKRTEIGWGIETIFPYKETLFLGANDGMFIFDISDRETPKQLSEFSHVRSCDPVVVQGDYAFVTLRSGNTCFGSANQLDIIDISDLTDPTLKYSYEMDNPYGLGVDGNCLFVTQNDFGMKVFDIKDLSKLEENVITNIDSIHATDVIPYNGNLMVLGGDGLRQYDYNCGDTSSLNYKSSINWDRSASL